LHLEGWWVSGSTNEMVMSNGPNFSLFDLVIFIWTLETVLEKHTTLWVKAVEVKSD
jgi:hypothetical protein